MCFVAVGFGVRALIVNESEPQVLEYSDLLSSAICLTFLITLRPAYEVPRPRVPLTLHDELCLTPVYEIL